MSDRQSALASLTANYTDSEDDDSSPPLILNDDGDDIDIRIGVLSQDESSQDGLRQPRSVDSGGSGTANSLVSYYLETDLIDDDVIDNFPGGLNPTPGTPHGERITGGEVSPRLKSDLQSPIHASMDTEAVSSEDDMVLSPKVKLPAEPTGKCSAKLQEKFATMYEGKLKGSLNMNELIQTRKMFRNPSIYEKLILHLDIDEFGTNYPENMFNPHEWSESSYYDELAKLQKAEMDRREKERRDRTKVDFVSGTAKKNVVPVASVSGSGTQSEGDTKRKSKWDQRGVMPLLITIGASAPSHPIALPASIVNSVNAAKAKTVTINAFGSLPKKSK